MLTNEPLKATIIMKSGRHISGAFRMATSEERAALDIPDTQAPVIVGYEANSNSLHSIPWENHDYIKDIKPLD